MKHINISISGKVENTGFRFHVFWGACINGIHGFVMIKNNTVIIEAEGEDDKLTLFSDWVRQGPEGSMVNSMISCDKEVIGYDDFKIL